MNFKRLFLIALLSSVGSMVLSMDSRSADAQQSFTISRTYKVEVEYWFFDTDYYYWSTVLETNDHSEAQFLFSILQWAKDNHQLNAFAPHSYWRYIAVDVRMRTEYNWNYLQPSQYELAPLEWRF